MKADLMEKMLDAGFTKEEIFRILDPAPATGTATAAAPAPAPDKEPAPAPEKEPEKEPAAAPAPEPEKEPTKAPAAPADPKADETEKRLAGIEQSISDLIKTLQAENIKRDSFGGTPDSLEEQTDRIMASIIRPETAKRKDD